MKQAQLSYLQVCALSIACKSVKRVCADFTWFAEQQSGETILGSKCRRVCATKEGFPAHLTCAPWQLGSG
jgi:hypothetical protein